jgi:hypothetical protein
MTSSKKRILYNSRILIVVFPYALQNAIASKISQTKYQSGDPLRYSPHSRALTRKANATVDIDKDPKVLCYE